MVGLRNQLQMELKHEENTEEEESYADDVLKNFLLFLHRKQPKSSSELLFHLVFVNADRPAATSSSG